MLLVGWLAHVTPHQASDARLPRSWLFARLLVASSLALQYAASLSAPPSVWPQPLRRPWHSAAREWPLANHTCARLGVEASEGTSGLVCWMGVDGMQPTSILLWEMAALGAITLRCLCAGRDGSSGGTRRLSCRGGRWREGRECKRVV